LRIFSTVENANEKAGPCRLARQVKMIQSETRRNRAYARPLPPREASDEVRQLSGAARGSAHVRPIFASTQQKQ
jgi:hypothetical protein